MAMTATEIEPAKRLRLFKNGDESFLGKDVVCSQRTARTWESFLHNVTQELGCREAIRNICTPTGGTPVRSMAELCDRFNYVAVGRGPFKKIGYLNLQHKQPPKFSWSPRGNPHSTAEEPVKPVDHSRMQVPGRIRDIPIDAIHIFVYANGESLEPAHRVNLPRRSMDRWDSIINEVNQKVHLKGGRATKSIYTMEGHMITSPHQLENGSYYVAVGPDSRGFIKADYGNLVKPAFYVPMKMGSRGNQQNELWSSRSTGYLNIQKKPSVNRHKASSYGGESSGAASSESDRFHAGRKSYPGSVNQAVEPRQRFKRVSSDQQDNSPFYAKQNGGGRWYREVNYDKDDGGLFKANHQRRETEGAEEIHENAHTKVDLPVDMRELEEIQEEFDVQDHRTNKTRKVNETSKSVNSIAFRKMAAGNGHQPQQQHPQQPPHQQQQQQQPQQNAKPFDKRRPFERNIKDPKTEENNQDIRKPYGQKFDKTTKPVHAKETEQETKFKSRTNEVEHEEVGHMSSRNVHPQSSRELEDDILEDDRHPGVKKQRKESESLLITTKQNLKQKLTTSKKQGEEGVSPRKYNDYQQHDLNNDDDDDRETDCDDHVIKKQRKEGEVRAKTIPKQKLLVTNKQGEESVSPRKYKEHQQHTPETDDDRDLGSDSEDQIGKKQRKVTDAGIKPKQIPKKKLVTDIKQEDEEHEMISSRKVKNQHGYTGRYSDGEDGIEEGYHENDLDGQLRKQRKQFETLKANQTGKKDTKEHVLKKDMGKEGGEEEVIVTSRSHQTVGKYNEELDEEFASGKHENGFQTSHRTQVTHTEVKTNKLPKKKDVDQGDISSNDEGDETGIIKKKMKILKKHNEIERGDDKDVKSSFRNEFEDEKNKFNEEIRDPYDEIEMQD